MARVALFIVILFVILLALRMLRHLFAALARRTGRFPVDGEMVRDPVCGTWIDRRLALAGRRGQEWLPVCSEKCKSRLESR